MSENPIEKVAFNAGLQLEYGDGVYRLRDGDRTVVEIKRSGHKYVISTPYGHVYVATSTTDAVNVIKEAVTKFYEVELQRMRIPRNIRLANGVRISIVPSSKGFSVAHIVGSKVTEHRYMRLDEFKAYIQPMLQSRQTVKV